MIEPSVPKPSLSFVSTNDEKCDVAADVNREPKPDVNGRPCELASKRAQEAGARIVADLGAALSSRDRKNLVTAFRRTLLPPKRPGRRCKETITAAHRDWQNVMHGPALYRADIPGWEKHNRFRRKCEAQTLMDAIRTRERREQERTARKLGSARLAGGPVEVNIVSERTPESATRT